MIGGIVKGSFLLILSYNNDDYEIEERYKLLLLDVISFTIVGLIFGGFLDICF